MVYKLTIDCTCSVVLVKVGTQEYR